MIKNLLDSKFLARQQKQVINQLVSEAQRIKDGDPLALKMSEKNGVSAQDLLDLAARLREPAPEAGSRDRLAYIPRDPMQSVLQGALEQAYHAAGAVAPPSMLESAGEFTPVSSDELLPEFAVESELEGFVQFQEGDPLYGAMYATAAAGRLFRSRPGFNPNPARVSIANNARVILFGDWGSGIKRAQAMGDVIKGLLAATPEREGHAIHLGDVYYAGFDDDYKSRFLPFWPGQAGRSWSLSGNHDMYTGGHGFFKVLLGDSRFSKQAGASWFVLENDDWQICGMDSSYNPPDWRGDKGDFTGNQGDFVRDLREANRNKGGVLLTHHQPFSAYEGESPKMTEKLKPVLDQGLARAWFWGHEHRCAAYEPRNNISYPCLIGHSGIPVPFEGKPKPAGVRFQWDDDFTFGDDRYITMGCVVLDFNADRIDVSYFNEFGKEVVPGDGRHSIAKT